jgi:hypothetical protein
MLREIIKAIIALDPETLKAILELIRLISGLIKEDETMGPKILKALQDLKQN